MHAGTSKTNADGTSLSQCNAFIADGSKTKHATTVTFAPGVIVKFFEDFVKQLTTRDNEVIEKLAKQALNQNTQQINSGGSASNFNKFWALPFIAIEDNLERMADETTTWIDKAREKGLPTHVGK